MVARPARIVFFGNERLATGVTTTAPTLQALIAAGYQVVAVVSHHAASTGKGRDLEIAAVAEQHQIPLLLPERPADVLEQLRDLQPDIGVLVAYGKIVPQTVIDLFPHGILNIHPSLLPLHRGSIPVEAVMLEGAAQTGVSIMQLVRAMDAGPVYAQERLNLSGKEDKHMLATGLLQRGGQLLLSVLPSVLDGQLQPQPQTEDQATYDSLIQKLDGQLDFTKSAARLTREVRAYADWPRSYTTLPGTDKQIIVTAAHIEPSDDMKKPGTIWHQAKSFGFYTSDGIFAIDRLKPAGKSEMSAAAFLAGYRLV